MSAARGGAGAGVAARKRISHALKTALFRSPHLDATIDDLLSPGGNGWREALREQGWLRLLPERRFRSSPFDASGRGSAIAADAHRLLVLSLVPPEDSGGGSRPAQLAAELHRRGWRIDWRWALPIYPWPAGRRPRVDGIEVHHVDETAPPTGPAADLALLEAPHPKLLSIARAPGVARRLAYDAIDAWEGSLGAGWWTRAAEDEAIGTADILLASARSLRDDVAARSGRPVALVPNAFDPRRFDPGAACEPDASIRHGNPTVGFVGALWGDWVDLDLVADLARLLPRATFNLVGPTGDRAMPRADNVFVLGARPQSAVPAFLRGLDVALIPFTNDRTTAAVSPLKVFEYLAMGLPVVSSPLPELEGVPGVRTAASPSEFAAAIEEAARTPVPVDQVRDYLSGQTWSARVDALCRAAGLPTHPGRGTSAGAVTAPEGAGGSR